MTDEEDTNPFDAKRRLGPLRSNRIKESKPDRPNRKGLRGFMSRPLHGRLRVRRSTALMAVAFLGFGALYLQYPPLASPSSRPVSPAAPPTTTTTTTTPPKSTTTTSSTTTTTSTSTTTTTVPSSTTSPSSTTTTTAGSATTSPSSTSTTVRSSATSTTS